MKIKDAVSKMLAFFNAIMKFIGNVMKAVDVGEEDTFEKLEGIQGAVDTLGDDLGV